MSCSISSNYRYYFRIIYSIVTYTAIIEELTKTLLTPSIDIKVKVEIKWIIVLLTVDKYQSDKKTYFPSIIKQVINLSNDCTGIHSGILYWQCQL